MDVQMFWGFLPRLSWDPKILSQDRRMQRWHTKTLFNMFFCIWVHRFYICCCCCCHFNTTSFCQASSLYVNCGEPFMFLFILVACSRSQYINQVRAPPNVQSCPNCKHFQDAEPSLHQKEANVRLPLAAIERRGCANGFWSAPRLPWYSKLLSQDGRMQR